MGRQIKLMIVDDSRFMVSVITAVVAKAGDVEVVGFALDGESAVQQVATLKPDVITMDVHMPRMDGIQATRIITRQFGVPILILSAHTPEGARKTLEALEAGAADCIAKPSGELSLSLDSIADRLIEKIRGVSRHGMATTARMAATVLPAEHGIPTPEPVTISRTGTHLGMATTRPRPLGTAPDQLSSGLSPIVTDTQSLPQNRATGRTPPAIVAIGSSAGGIQILTKILPIFDNLIGFAVLVVQHFPQGFTSELASRLSTICRIPVVEATHNMRLTRATISIAPGGKNLEVTSAMRVRLSEEEGSDVVRPSIDVAFRSLARVFGPAAVGMILTGMGKDGSEGVRSIFDAGGTVLVQDPQTATAYGMPRSAIETGCIHAVLPVEQLVPAVLRLSRPPQR